MSLDALIDEYRCTLQHLDERERSHQSSLDCAHGALSDLHANFAERALFWRIFTYLPYKFKCWSIKADIDSHTDGINELPSQRDVALKVLVLEAARFLMINGDASEQLTRMEQEHLDLRALYRSAVSVRDYGANALSKIAIAIDTVESAQTLEIMDGFTQNKTVSTISTVSNFSASDDVAAARQAIECFQSKLEDHRKFASLPEHSVAIETIDLVVDIFFGGVLDMIGSALSYFALSDAEAQLKEAQQHVEKAHGTLAMQCEAIREKVTAHEERLLAFKHSQRTMIVPVLCEKGIDVTTDFVASITDLYAPSTCR